MNQYSYIDFKFEQGKCQPLCIVLSASELQAELACSRKQLLKGDVVPTVSVTAICFGDALH